MYKQALGLNGYTTQSVGIKQTALRVDADSYAYLYSLLSSGDWTFATLDSREVVKIVGLIATNTVRIERAQEYTVAEAYKAETGIRFVDTVEGIEYLSNVTSVAITPLNAVTISNGQIGISAIWINGSGFVDSGPNIWTHDYAICCVSSAVETATVEEGDITPNLPADTGNLLTNSSFDTDLSNWDIEGVPAEWSIVNGKATFTPSDTLSVGILQATDFVSFWEHEYPYQTKRFSIKVTIEHSASVELGLVWKKTSGDIFRLTYPLTAGEGLQAEHWRTIEVPDVEYYDTVGVFFRVSNATGRVFVDEALFELEMEYLPLLHAYDRSARNFDLLSGTANWKEVTWNGSEYELTDLTLWNVVSEELVLNTITSDFALYKLVNELVITTTGKYINVLVDVYLPSGLSGGDLIPLVLIWDSEGNITSERYMSQYRRLLTGGPGSFTFDGWIYNIPVGSRISVGFYIYSNEVDGLKLSNIYFNYT